MLPLEHFLAAFLPVLAFFLLRYRQLPSLGVVFVVFVGSQFPDLVDKPLSLANVIPWGRVFMHSLPFALPMAAVVLLYAVATDQQHLGGGFVFAYLLHIPGDWYGRLLSGEIPPDLLWPIMSIPAHPDAPGWGGPGDIYAYMWSFYSILLLSLVFMMLTADISYQLTGEKESASGL
jgi:hypothetical protein